MSVPVPPPPSKATKNKVRAITWEGDMRVAQFSRRVIVMCDLASTEGVKVPRGRGNWRAGQKEVEKV
jgi:hypothetical protein